MVPTMRTMRRTVSRRGRTIRSLTTTSRPSSAKSSDTASCETSAQTLPSPRANAHILSRAHNPSSAAQLFAVGSMRCDRWPQSHRHVLTGMQCSAVPGSACRTTQVQEDDGGQVEPPVLHAQRCEAAALLPHVAVRPSGRGRHAQGHDRARRHRHSAARAFTRTVGSACGPKPFCDVLCAV